MRKQCFNIVNLKKSPFFREFLFFSSSSILWKGSHFAVNLGVAKVLGPAAFGAWNTLNLVLVYGSVLHLGVINAMNRDVPLFKGRGDSGRAEHIRHVSLGFMAITTLVAAVVILIIPLFMQLSPLIEPSLLWMALLLIGTQLYSYLQVYLKSDRRFYQLSCQQFLHAGALPAIAIPLILRYALPGYILGQTIAILVVSFLIAKFIPFDFKLRFDWYEIVRLIKVGFPLMSVGLLYGLLVTADRWVILSFLSLEHLGYYSLTIMATSILTLFPIVLTQQIYPRMAETFGRTSDPSSLKPLILRQVLISVVITVPMGVGVYFLFPPFVRHFLPDYTEGITAMRIIIFGLLFLPLSGAFGNFLNTTDKQVYYMFVLGVSILINLGLNVGFVKAGFGINGVALGTTITYALYSLILVFVGQRLGLGKKSP